MVVSKGDGPRGQQAAKVIRGKEGRKQQQPETFKSTYSEPVRNQ